MDSLFAGADLIAEMMAAIGKGGSDADFATGEVLQGLPRWQWPRCRRRRAAPARLHGCGRLLRGAGRRRLRGAARRDRGCGDFEKLQLAEARDRGEALLKLTVSVDEAEDDEVSPGVPRVFQPRSRCRMSSRSIRRWRARPAEDALYGRTTVLLTSARRRRGHARGLRRRPDADVPIERCAFDAFLSGANGGSRGTSPSPWGSGHWRSHAQGAPEHGAARRRRQDEQARRTARPWRRPRSAWTHGSSTTCGASSRSSSCTSPTSRASPRTSATGKDVHTVREELVESSIPWTRSPAACSRR